MSDTRTYAEFAAFSLAREGASEDRNEDSYRLAGGDGENPWADFVAVVADGVGSSRDPAGASRAAAEAWVQFLERRFTERPAELSSFDEAQFGQVMRECFAQAHRQALKSAPGGSATAAGVCVQGDWLLAATVGDARIYHLRDGALEQVTPDQIDGAGNPTDVLGGRQAAPNANVYARRSLAPGDWIVACSDGLQKTLPLPELEELLRSSDSPQLAVRALRQRAVSRQVADDVTAAVARIVQVGEPFWERNGNRSGSSRAASPAGGLKSSGRTTSPTAPTKTEKEPSMQAGSDLSPLIGELEKRIARLERSPNAAELSPQEQARLEREFGQLERQIQDLAAQVSKRTGFPLAAFIAGMLACGVVIGYLMGAFFTNGAKPTLPSKEVAGRSITLQQPEDMDKLLGYQTTDNTVVLRYRSSDGGTKVAVYRYEDGGKPSLSFELPSDNEPATGAGSRGGSRPATVKPLRSKQR
jgi:protein phosphatase